MSEFLDQRPLCMVPRSRTEWLSGGVPARDLGSSLFRRTSRGYYLPWNTGRVDGGLLTTQLVLDAVPEVPATGAIGGWAAAFVLGVDWMTGESRSQQIRVPVHIGRRSGRSGTNVRFVHDVLDPDEVQTTHDLAVTTPLRTTFDVVRWSNDLTDAVAALDSMLAARLLGLHELHGLVARRPGWRGVAVLRRAIELADPHVLSPAESWLRVICVVDAGWTGLLVNPWVFDGEWVLVGRPDLYDAASRHALEYDGTYHHAPEQVGADRLREDGFSKVDVITTRVVAEDLQDRIGLVIRLKRERTKAELTHQRTGIHVIPAGRTVDIDGVRPPAHIIAMIQRIERSRVESVGPSA